MPSARLRWYVCGLLFLATTINYIDRQILGLLKPILEKELGWREDEYGWIVSAFQGAYALMMPLAGRIIDWIGTRTAYAGAVFLWSLAAMAHAVAGSAPQFAVARFALGLSEAANFPAAIRTTADFFSQQQRALATGIFNSGTNMGALIAPLLVPWLTARYGWRAAFVITGAIGFFWIVLWFAFYRKPSQTEADSPARVSYLRLMRTRQAWAFFLCKSLTDPVWWFYLFWLPAFLNRTYRLDLLALGPPLIVIYLSADLGSVGGGWLSSALLARGWTAAKARKTAMLICACAVVGVMGVPLAGGRLWIAVALVSLATMAHQGWSANLFTMTSDLFPRQAVGSVVGFGGLGGALGGMVVAPMVGYWLEFSHGAYGALFVVAGAMYLVALALIHWLCPDFEPARL